MPDLSANYLSTDAAGAVTADFSGGVTMPLQAATVTAQKGASVAWTDGPGGAKLAWVGASKSAVNGQVIAGVFAKDDAAGTRQAQVLLYATPAADTSSIRLQAKDSNTIAGERLLLDSNGGSDYVFGGGAPGAAMHIGFVAVSPVGVLLATLGAINVTTAQVGTGSYTIVVNNWPAGATCFAIGSRGGTPGPAGFAIRDGTSPVAGLVQYFTFNTASGALQNFDMLIALAAVF